MPLGGCSWLKNLVIASHPHEGELPASRCQAACVWVMGNEASSSPGHLLEEQPWRCEGNPPRGEPGALLAACSAGGEAAQLCCAESCSSLRPPCPRGGPGVFVWTPLRRRGNSPHTPARKGNPKQLPLLRRDWERGQAFHTCRIKIRLLHPSVGSRSANTAWLTSFLPCLLCNPLTGQCFPLCSSSGSGPCTCSKYIYLSSR